MSSLQSDPRRPLIASLALCFTASAIFICLFVYHSHCHLPFVAQFPTPLDLRYGRAPVQMHWYREPPLRRHPLLPLPTATIIKEERDDGVAARNHDQRLPRDRLEITSVNTRTAGGGDRRRGIGIYTYHDDGETAKSTADDEHNHWSGYYTSYGNVCSQLHRSDNYLQELRRRYRRQLERRSRRRIEAKENRSTNITSGGISSSSSNRRRQIEEGRAMEVATDPEEMRSYRYMVVAVIANRIFAEDKFGVGAYEARQWIEYMLYAGVEHVFWYDTAHHDGEVQRHNLAAYANAGLLTYHRFHGELFVDDSISRGYHFEQDESYRHFLRHYANYSKWVVELDVDEYPFSPSDTYPCFLQRFLWDYEQEQQRQSITQILMNCMFFLGNPEPKSKEAWVAEKYRRRKGNSEGDKGRQKPIFRAEEVEVVEERNPHRMAMREGGRTVVAEEGNLRMNHYWGARPTNFGPDTPDLLEPLIVDASAAEAIVGPLKAVTGLSSPARSPHPNHFTSNY